MPNEVQPPSQVPGTPVSTQAGGDPTAEFLVRIIPSCSACNGSLDGHNYRFYACHPVPSADAADLDSAAFLQAIHVEDWATVQSIQLPAVDQPLYVLFAIACPHPPEGSGMAVLLLTQPEAQSQHTLLQRIALTPDSMAVLRAQCPTCPWIALTPLHLQQQAV